MREGTRVGDERRPLRLAGHRIVEARRHEDERWPFSDGDSRWSRRAAPVVEGILLEVSAGRSISLSTIRRVAVLGVPPEHCIRHARRARAERSPSCRLERESGRDRRPGRPRMRILSFERSSRLNVDQRANITQTRCGDRAERPRDPLHAEDEVAAPRAADTRAAAGARRSSRSVRESTNASPSVATAIADILSTSGPSRTHPTTVTRAAARQPAPPRELPLARGGEVLPDHVQVRPHPAVRGRPRRVVDVVVDQRQIRSQLAADSQDERCGGQRDERTTRGARSARRRRDCSSLPSTRSAISGAATTRPRLSLNRADTMTTPPASERRPARPEPERDRGESKRRHHGHARRVPSCSQRKRVDERTGEHRGAPTRANVARAPSPTLRRPSQTTSRANGPRTPAPRGRRRTCRRRADPCCRRRPHTACRRRASSPPR